MQSCLQAGSGTPSSFFYPVIKPLVLEKWKWKLKDVPLDSIDPLQLVRPFYSHEVESISVGGWVEVSFFLPQLEKFPLYC